MEYRLGIYEKAMPNEYTWRERLEAAKKGGFDFLEISVDESDARLARLEWSDGEIRELYDLSRSVGLPIETMCLSGHRKYPMGSGVPEIRARSMDIMKKAIRLADGLGVRIIQLAGYDVYYHESSTAETRERFIEGLRISAEWASAYGIMLALETMENDFCNTVSKAMDFVRAVDSPYLQIYPDVGNVSNATPAPRGDLLTGHGHIVAAHLKETVPGVFRDLFYGEGQVDFPAVTSALWDMGVRRFNAEFWHNGTDRVDERLSAASAYLREILDQKGRRQA